MQFEHDRLLACAECVADVLKITESAAPVEGYYTATPQLTRYFRLMRSLQRQPASCSAAVNELDEFHLLRAVTSSPMYGRVDHPELLLPQPRDPLDEALAHFPPSKWNVADLVQEAHRVAMKWDDISLVGLAARIQEPVLLAGVRESVALYS